MAPVIVMTTTDTEEKARSLASAAVEARLGACAQIVGPITSVYRWQGEIQVDPEWRVEIKTTDDHVDPLTEHLRRHHDYDVPEVVAVPITGGSAPYLDWLHAETR